MARGQRYAEVVKATCVKHTVAFFVAKRPEMWYSMFDNQTVSYTQDLGVNDT
jgi:hypothetical protein